MNNVGDKIRYQREVRELTRKQLAELSGVAEVSITQYELGKRQPRTEQLTKIATALDIDPFVLITADSYPEEHYQKWLETADPIYKYLDSLGYTVDAEKEPFKLGEIVGSKGTGNTILKSKEGSVVVFSKDEFKQLQSATREVIDTRFFRKLMEQQKPPTG